ncbi:MAG: Ger(x)C family spore germination protein [Lysinibacillus sp.]
MKKILIILLLPLTIVLSGCWDVDEPERMLYIHGIGLDYKDGQFEIYAQIIDFSNIAKSDQPSTSPAQSQVGHAKGKTMEEAFFNLYHSTDQKVFWGTFSYLLLSENMLKSGEINVVVDSFLRFQEMRYQVWLYGTKDSPKDVLLTTPVINKAIILSKLSDPMNSHRQQSYIQPINFRKFIIGLDEPGHEIAIPSISIKENWESNEGPAKVASLEGVAVLSKETLKGFITGDKANGLQWMTNETDKGGLTFTIDKGEKVDLTVDLSNIKVDIKPNVKNDSAKFNITVKMDAVINGLQAELTNKDIREGIIKEVKNEIKDTYEEALKQDIDIYRLSEQLYRKDVKAWKKMQKKGKIALTEDSIDKLTVEITSLKSGKKNFKETIDK